MSLSRLWNDHGKRDAARQLPSDVYVTLSADGRLLADQWSPRGRQDHGPAAPRPNDSSGVVIEGDLLPGWIVSGDGWPDQEPATESVRQILIGEPLMAAYR